MNRYVVAFLSSFAVFLFYLTPNVNSGDAGELITASYFLGIAHPSGYPLYAQLGKAFTFLPFGNMAFRVALMSALFGALSLTIIFWAVFNLTGNKVASLFTLATLMTSYSFLTQSVIAKFYPLNLFIILVVYALWLHVCLYGFKEWAALITAFLCGLTLSNHHTGILIALPSFIAMLSFRKFLSVKLLFLATVAFLLGTAVNIFVFIRGTSVHFFNSYTVDNFYNFYRLFLRLDYGESSSIAVSGNTLSDVRHYWYALRNFLSLLTKDFSVFSYPLACLGGLFLFGKNRKILLFIAIGLFLYGPVLAKMAFFKEISLEKDYYYSGHQYFLPAFSFYAMLLGTGIHQISLWLRPLRFRFLPKVVSATLVVLPLTFLVSRAADSNYRTNYVPYQATKDMYSIIPVKGVLLAYGDDAIYQSWYIKLIGRYRDDVCVLGSASQKEGQWHYQGCNREMYENAFPEILSRKIRNILPLIEQRKIYGTDMVNDDFAYKKYMRSRYFSLLHLYMPSKEPDGKEKTVAGDIDAFIRSGLINAEKIVNPSPCLSHLTDDYLTRSICSRYIVHFTELSELYSDAKYGSTGQKMSVRFLDDNKKLKATYTVDVTDKNRPYLAYTTLIQEYNKWNIYYIRRK